ncbi:MAG: polysaccharide pyruvyl transferase family protein [Sandaracinobacteroides sp.]
MTSVILRGLPSLDNFGTAMMAMVAIQALAGRIPGRITFKCNLFPTTDVDEIFSELDVDRDRISIMPFVRKPRPRLASPGGLLHRWRMVRGDPATADANLYVVLGGDDLSEYYNAQTWRELVSLWLYGRTMPVILLGQTIGPFQLRLNRLAARFILRDIPIIARDRWTTHYLQTEFGLGSRLQLGADLAWMDLPLQHRADISSDTLARFGLLTDAYATVVISAMQGMGYYTPDRGIYLQRWKETIEALLDLPEMAGRKICLLAHTFAVYGDEGRNIVDVCELLSDAARARVVAIPDRLLPTRARFILGNGLFTISGRMHPAVSTFQMGKPAITLSYSKKYEGVIGTMIGRADLILEGNDPALWADGTIVSNILAKARDVLARHPALCSQVQEAVGQQKLMAASSLDLTAALVRTTAATGES